MIRFPFRQPAGRPSGTAVALIAGIALAGAGAVPARAQSGDGSAEAPKPAQEHEPGEPMNVLPEKTPVPGDAPQIESVESALETMRQAAPPLAEELDRPGRVGVADRKRPLFDAQPIRAGGYDIYPEVYSNVTADTNLLRMSGSSADVYYEGGARIAAESDWSRHAVNLSLAARERVHATYDDEDFWTASASLRTRIDVSSRFRLTADAQAGRDVELRGAAGSIVRSRSPVRYDFADVGLSGRYEGGRLDFDGLLQVQKRDFFDNVSVTGVPVDLQYRDSTRLLAGGGVGWSFGPRLAVVASARYDRIEYRVSPTRNRNSHGWRLLAGLRGELTPLIRGRLTAGLIQRSYRDPALGKTNHLAFDGEIEWLMTDMTTLKFSAVRDVVNSANLIAPVELRTTLTASMDHELLRNVIISGSIQHFDSDYAEIGQKDRSDLVSISARWMLNPKMEFNARADVQRRRASAALPGLDYNDGRLTIGIRMRI